MAPKTSAWLTDPTCHTTIRLPGSLYDSLRELAKEDERSLNSEMVYALKLFAHGRIGQRDTDDDRCR